MSEFQQPGSQVLDDDLSDDVEDEANNGKRDRSTVRFPYADLNAAIEIAQGIKQYGLQCAVSDLASAVDQSISSGAFRGKMSAAQTFGLAKSSRGFMSLTELGKKITDPNEEAAARVDAFLHVELYKLVHDDFAGTSLPDDSGLERHMVQLGVAPKQASRARQAFQRSAEQAGFFRGSKTRLARPPLAGLQNQQPEDKNEDKDRDTGKPDPTGLRDHPLLTALWQTLPADKPFSAEARRRFFATLAFNIDYVYGEPSDGSFNPMAMAELWKVQPNYGHESTTQG